MPNDDDLTAVQARLDVQLKTRFENWHRAQDEIPLDFRRSAFAP